MQIHLTFYYCDCKCKLTIAKTRPKILHSNANGSKNAMSCHVVVYGDTSFSHVARSVMRMHTNLEYQNFMSMLMMVDVLSALNIQNSVTKFSFFFHKQKKHYTEYIQLLHLFVCVCQLYTSLTFRVLLFYAFGSLALHISVSFKMWRYSRSRSMKKVNPLEN